MRKDKSITPEAPPASDKAAPLVVSEDEDGMRLDRWLKRRFTGMPQSHLMKVVRKGEVRVEGKRAEISTRLEAGQSVRVPPVRRPRRRRSRDPPSEPRGRRSDPRDDPV